MDIVRYLVEGGAVDVNEADADGFTPLIMAATNGHTDIVRFLVEEGKADVRKAKAKVGATPSSWRRNRGTRRSYASWWRRARQTWTVTTDDGAMPSSWRRRRGTRRSCDIWWKGAKRTLI